MARSRMRSMLQGCDRSKRRITDGIAYRTLLRSAVYHDRTRPRAGAVPERTGLQPRNRSAARAVGPLPSVVGVVPEHGTAAYGEPGAVLGALGLVGPRRRAHRSLSLRFARPSCSLWQFHRDGPARMYSRSLAMVSPPRFPASRAVSDVKRCAFSLLGHFPAEARPLPQGFLE